MLQIFNLSWSELAQKMPEIAEAGYDSLWLPPPYKSTSGASSVGYDVFDPFDLGDLNQQGTTATKWGTKAQLLTVVQLAHRFGIRVYFDNITNHRGTVVPGYDASTPTNYYPGLAPQDFHLLTSGAFFRNVPNVSDWNNQWNVQNESLLGLVDLAQEPGGANLNFGPQEGQTIPKISFIRQPMHPDYYMDASLPAIAGPWHPFNGTNGQPSSEDVGAYLCRAAAWMVNATLCDGFRLDAVKHVPSGFFGDTSDSPNGYCGAIQTMFDYVHGYGHNAAGNGYMEADDNRNSEFDTESPRNDAMIFGEHLGEPPTYGEYITRGMRLLNAPGQNSLNNILGVPGATMSGMDSTNWGTLSGFQAVQFSQSADNTYCGVSYAARALQNAYNFLRVGLPEIYTDGYNQSQGSSPFPGVPNANYLGQFGDQTMPDLAWLQHQLARGQQTPRWSDSTTVCFERYDNRDGGAPQDQVTVLFAMNDYMVAGQGDQCFYDTVGPNDSCSPITNSRNIGLVVGFPPGSVLAQLASGPTHSSNLSWAFDNSPACPTLLVRPATSDFTMAQNTAGDPNPANRAVYVGGQTLAPGGGAVEFKIPAGSYVCYGYQWPEPSRAALTDAISFRQAGAAPPTMTFFRHDGTNGDPNFNPVYPFKMRGRIDQNGNVISGQNVSNRVYSVDIPIITNGSFDILVRNDASSSNVLVKLDGGIDLNSQMGIGPLTTHTAQLLDLRDNKPGNATDVCLGYEQAAFDFRCGPEKFAAENVARDNVTISNAEIYSYVVGGGVTVSPGAGNGATISNSTAQWVYHNPGDVVYLASNAPATQLNPPSPLPGQSADVWVKVGYQFQVNQGSIYYTTDGSPPVGSFGVPKGASRSAPLSWIGHDLADPTIDWWKGTIPASANASGTTVRYALALFETNIAPVSDAAPDKRYGLSEASITSFSPTTALVWTANDLNTNNLALGLQSGFHIVRARSFLPRPGKSSVFNTFSQTFYYDAGPPSGQVVSPPAAGMVAFNTSTIIVRAASSCTSASFNIADSDPNNDDGATHIAHGNGLSNGAPVFVTVAPSANTPSLDSQYPNLPVEFHFTYAAVPSSGGAAVTVRLNEITTQLIPGRFTTVTQTFQTAAPPLTLQISNPAQDGAPLLLASTNTFNIAACFSSSLAVDPSPFTLTINGAPGSRSLYSLGGQGCAPGLTRLNYLWSNAVAGTNVIGVAYQGDPVLAAQRTVVVFDPHSPSSAFGLPGYQYYVAGTDPNNPSTWLKILSESDGLVTWNCVSNKSYQVLATTNLSFPFQPVSPTIVATNGRATFLDAGRANAAQKFYLIQVFP